MKYNPAEAVSCLPEGDYAATIIGAEETSSKAGKDMIVVTYKVYHPHKATTYQIKDYIVAPGALWKLKKLAAAIGQTGAFESGEFRPSDYIDRNLTLALKVEEDPKFGDKNVVGEYKPKGLAVVAAASYTPPPDALGGEDIPF